MITVIVIRNTMGWAITGYAYVGFRSLLSAYTYWIYRVTPWITNLGVQNTFISAGFISMATSLVFLVMIKWGKHFREMSRLRYWQYVERGKALGMSH